MDLMVLLHFSKVVYSCIRISGHAQEMRQILVTAQVFHLDRWIHNWKVASGWYFVHSKIHYFTFSFCPICRIWLNTSLILFIHLFPLKRLQYYNNFMVYLDLYFYIPLKSMSICWKPFSTTNLWMRNSSGTLWRLNLQSQSDIWN